MEYITIMYFLGIFWLMIYNCFDTGQNLVGNHTPPQVHWLYGDVDDAGKDMAYLADRSLCCLSDPTLKSLSSLSVLLLFFLVLSRSLALTIARSRSRSRPSVRALFFFSSPSISFLCLSLLSFLCLSLLISALCAGPLIHFKTASTQLF